MADLEERASDDAPLNMVNSSVIHERVKIILNDIGCKPRMNIVETLEEEISMDLLEETRLTIFRMAILRYEAQLTENGVTSKPNLSLKLRRSKSINNRYAYDIVELALYVCEYIGTFPRDIISSKSIYIELDANESNLEDTGTGTTSSNATGNAKKCDGNGNDVKNLVTVDDYKSAIEELKSKCLNQEDSIAKLWEYVLNLEKIIRENVTDKSNVAVDNSELKPCNESRERGTHGESQTHATQTGDNRMIRSGSIPPASLATNSTDHSFRLSQGTFTTNQHANTIGVG